MLSQLFADPQGMLRSLLIMLPGYLLALSIHEAAHGWVAERCGDSTARYAGRITLNPLAHIDPLGLICMFVIGFGWAKPVPVNPLLYKNYRKDDLKVSMAGICANLCLCIVCLLLITALLCVALEVTPEYDTWLDQQMNGNGEEVFIAGYRGEKCFFGPDGYAAFSGLFRGYYDYYVIESALGRVGGIVYEMLLTCMYMNIALAVFNLLPIPPLDGYHLLNDLILRRQLFARHNVTRIASTVLVVLIVAGNYFPRFDILSISIGWVRTNVADGLYWLVRQFVSLIGII